MLTTTDMAVGDHTLHVSTTGDPKNDAVLWLHGSGAGATALSNWGTGDGGVGVDSGS